MGLPRALFVYGKRYVRADRIPEYYRFDPKVMSLDEVLDRWVRDHEKAYDGPFLLPIEDVWPYREYKWSRENHRGGAVPLRKNKKEKKTWGFMSDTHHGKYVQPTEEQLKALSEGPFGEPFLEGNRWDYLLKYMKKHGWDKDDPGHLYFGKNRVIKLGEGNHRIALAKEAGLKLVPMMFHFWGTVTFNKQV